MDEIYIYMAIVIGFPIAVLISIPFIAPKRWFNFARIPFYEFLLYDGKKFIKRYIVKKVKLAGSKDWHDKKLKLSFFVPKKLGFLEKSGEIHFFDVTDAEELGIEGKDTIKVGEKEVTLTDEQKEAKYKYVAFHELFGIKWKTGNVTEKLIKEPLTFTFVGVNPKFYHEILNTEFTAKIIKNPQKFNIGDYIIPILIVVSLLAVLYFFAGGFSA